MNIKTLTLGALGTNCYILGDTERGKCAIIDPADNVGRILQESQNMGLEIECILITHAHFDHILALDTLCEKTGAPVYIGKGDKAALKFPELNLSAYMGERFAFSKETIGLSGGDEIPFGKSFIKVVETPGHTEGGVCYICDEAKCIFTGDTVFAESIGRYDFPGGDYSQIIDSLNRILNYPPEYILYPGHGISTTVEREINRNPYYVK
jgi:glyoxylase-like metal-dependent hydrolase (beta-lactamase superfamily II)